MPNPKYRQPVSPKVHAEVLERDGQECRKCGRRKNLHVHHIIAHIDGGSDEPDNLTTICGPCHAEWHALDDWFDFTFDKWLTLPPYAVLVGMFLADWPEEIPRHELKETLLMTHGILRFRHNPNSMVYQRYLNKN